MSLSTTSAIRTLGRRLCTPSSASALLRPVKCKGVCQHSAAFSPYFLNSSQLQHVQQPLRSYCSSSHPSPPPSPPPSSTDAQPRLHMVFTCAKCDTRAVKSFTKNAYENGVVLVTCPGCEARHLIADNLGWFGEQDESNIEKILAKKGQSVTRITDKTGVTDIDYIPEKE